MTAHVVDRNTDEAFAAMVGDTALLALLRSKPTDDNVPSAVWWLVAETLRTTAAMRRALAGYGDGPACMLVDESVLLTEAALGELAAATGAHPTPVAVVPAAAKHRLRPGFSVQLSVLFLARMLVSHNSTEPHRLANTLAAHLRALASVES